MHSTQVLEAVHLVNRQHHFQLRANSIRGWPAKLEQVLVGSPRQMIQNPLTRPSRPGVTTALPEGVNKGPDSSQSLHVQLPACTTVIQD